MAISVAIVLTKPPYGDVDTVEGLKAASSIAAFGIDTIVVFMNDVVLSLTKTHKPEGINMASIHGSIKALVGARLAFHTLSLEERGLTKSDLLDDLELELVNDDYPAKLLTEVDIVFTM